MTGVITAATGTPKKISKEDVTAATKDSAEPIDYDELASAQQKSTLGQYYEAIEIYERNVGKATGQLKKNILINIRLFVFKAF